MHGFPSSRLLAPLALILLLAGCQSGPQLVENTEEAITAPASTPPIAEASTRMPITENFMPESMPEEGVSGEEASSTPAPSPETATPPADPTDPAAAPAKPAKTSAPATVKSTATAKTTKETPKPGPEGTLDSPPTAAEIKMSNEKPRPSKSENLKNASIKTPKNR